MKRIKQNTLQMNDLWIYAVCLAAMILLNFVGDAYEPISIALLFAMLMNDFSVIASCLTYLLSGLFAFEESALNVLGYAVSALFLLFAFLLSKRFGRKVKAEGIAYAAVALSPYVILFRDHDYAVLDFSPLLQRVLFAGVILLLIAMFTVGLKALLFKTFRCRLKSEESLFIAVMGVLLGLGLVKIAGNYTYTGVALLITLLAAYTFKNYEAVPFAVIAALPTVLTQWSALPMACFTVFSMISVFFSREGKILSAIGCFLSYVAASFLNGLYEMSAPDIVFTLLSGLAPCLLFCLLPNALFKKADEQIKAYRERQLPRIAINRNRAIVGEQLFEISSLFRQIEGTFFTIGENASLQETLEKTTRNVKNEMCSTCEKRQDCENASVQDAIEKLVNIGCAKGKVTLIDLPKEIATHCPDASGLLFAVNKELRSAKKIIEENEVAESGRALLAEQAHGISEVLKNIALDQSRPLTGYTEREKDLADALAKKGISSSEILLYGEEDNLTLSLTVFGKYEASEILSVVSKVFGVDFVLSEKIPISHDKFSYVLRKHTLFDAMFGVASKTKEGESVCGDTHTVIKIDERRFLVALADGSGSGERAREVSDATLSLLESFYRAKMPSDTILSTVNKLLTFSGDDSFSCLDIACVNLDSGEVDVVKLGAPLGFIFSGQEIRILENESLPIGTVENIHPTTLKTKMTENDVLVFLSDGVSAAFPSSVELFEFLKDFTPLNPQKLADDLLCEALARYGGVAKDDMTVVAVRLFAPVK